MWVLFEDENFPLLKHEQGTWRVALSLQSKEKTHDKFSLLLWPLFTFSFLKSQHLSGSPISFISTSICVMAELFRYFLRFEKKLIRRIDIEKEDWMALSSSSGKVFCHFILLLFLLSSSSFYSSLQFLSFLLTKGIGSKGKVYEFYVILLGSQTITDIDMIGKGNIELLCLLFKSSKVRNWREIGKKRK